LYFVYLDDHQHTFVYPSLQEESLSHTCVVDVDPVSLPQPIYKEECWRQIPSDPDHSCRLEEIEVVSKPSKISSPSSITIEPYYQLVAPHTHPTPVQSMIKVNLFKP